MNIFRKICYMWIITHGITDIFYPTHLWLYIYSVNMGISLLLPKQLLFLKTFLLSGLHFSKDFEISLYKIYFTLGLGIYFGDISWIQNSLLGYMSFIHVPIHYYKVGIINKWILYQLFCLLFSIGVYKNNYLLNKIDNIIKNKGNIEDTYINRCLYSVINSHIILNYYLMI